MAQRAPEIAEGGWPIFRSLGILPARRPAERFDRRPHARRDRHPRTDGHRPPRRIFTADRIFRLHRRLARLCHVRGEPLSVLRPQFHHHADLCRRPVADGGRGHFGLSGAGGSAGADGGRDPDRKQPVSAWLDRQSVIDAGDGRISRRHFHTHPGIANARRARAAIARRTDARPHRNARAASRRGQPLHDWHRIWRAGRRDGVREDQRQNFRRIDRVRSHCRGDLGRPRKQGRQRDRHRACLAADAVISRHLAGALGRAWCRWRC